jgi:hypothetical protein
MLTLGRAARLGTVPATGPATRHATPDVTDAELRYWFSRAEESLSELKSALEERDAWGRRLYWRKPSLPPRKLGLLA